MFVFAEKRFMTVIVKFLVAKCRSKKPPGLSRRGLFSWLVRSEHGAAGHQREDEEDQENRQRDIEQDFRN